MDKIFSEGEILNIKDVEKITNSFENNYPLYQELGGVINEEDYQRILEQARKPKALDERNPQIRSIIQQGTNIANYANIPLYNSENNFDLRIVLYVLLHTDFQPEGKSKHHGLVGDQRIFGEAVKMVGDADTLDKLIEAYPNIDFPHKNVRPDQLIQTKEAA